MFARFIDFSRYFGEAQASGNAMPWVSASLIFCVNFTAQEVIQTGCLLIGRLVTGDAKACGEEPWLLHSKGLWSWTESGGSLPCRISPQDLASPIMLMLGKLWLCCNFADLQWRKASQLRLGRPVPWSHRIVILHDSILLTFTQFSACLADWSVMQRL